MIITVLIYGNITKITVYYVRRTVQYLKNTLLVIYFTLEHPTHGLSAVLNQHPGQQTGTTKPVLNRSTTGFYAGRKPDPPLLRPTREL